MVNLACHHAVRGFLCVEYPLALLRTQKSAYIFCRERQLQTAKDSEGSHSAEIAGFQHALELRTQEAEQAKEALREREEDMKRARSLLSQKQDELSTLHAKLAEKDQEVETFAAALRVKEGELSAANKKVLEGGMQLSNLRAALKSRENELGRFVKSDEFSYGAIISMYYFVRPVFPPFI
jgi:septal ring factor EnvC (AmiA/AmiB activator)